KVGNGLLDICPARKQRIESSAAKAREQAERHADEGGKEGGSERDEQRDARTIQQAAVSIAAKRIAAKPVAGRRVEQGGRAQPRGEILCERVTRGKQRRGERAE